MTQSGTFGKRNWWWAAVLALVSGLLAWMLALRWRESGFQWSAFAATFARLNWGWVAAASALGLLTYCGRALRWQVMLKPLTPRPSFLNLMKATAIGFTAVVLFGRPGEFVRPYLISVKEKVSFSSQLAAWALERILDLLTVLLVFGLALARVRHASVGPGLSWVLQVGGSFVGVFGSVCVVILFVLRRYSDAMRRRLVDALGFLPARYLAKAEPLVNAFMAGLEATRSRAYLALLLAYTALEWMLIAACYLCLFRAFPETAHFGWNEALVFMGFVSFGSIVQIPGVGGGVQLVTVVVLTELFAVPLEPATSIALLTWIITFVVIIPPGLLLSFQEGLSWRKLRHLEAEAGL
jgi:uncharacterized protein (TIRG00374 family)